MIGYLRRKIRDVVRGNVLEPTLSDWFKFWMHEQNFGFRKNFSPANCYYEFGVGWGGTMSMFAQSAVEFCEETGVDINDIYIFGFDSFKGLPDKKSLADDHLEWEKGSFAFEKEHTLSILEDLNFPLDNVQLIEGYFEESLNDATFQLLKKRPPSIVTMDVDYYSSTKIALEFMAPLLQSGAVFYFDDLYSFHSHPDMGQVKAIREFNGKYGYLNPTTESKFTEKTFIYSCLEWEHAKEF